MLWLLLIIPALVGLYLLLLRRKKKDALRYASLAIVKHALGRTQSLRRHIPPVLLLLALTLMIVAIARPAAVIVLPSQEETIILAMDVSRSMLAADVEPNRISAAQSAAKAFVEAQPRTTRLGIVSFAATAAVVQTPTFVKQDLLTAIDRFQLQRGTATGSAIIVALATLFPEAGIDVESFGRRDVLRAGSLDKARTPDKPAFTPVEPGSYGSAAIILLTDGRRTTGPDPIEAARLAAERGVRVFAVGIGTTAGEMLGIEGWSMRVTLDEESLKTIANVTRGEYFYAGNAMDLKKVYQLLHTRLALEKKETEITALFSAAAALLAVISAGLSLLWFNRIL